MEKTLLKPFNSQDLPEGGRTREIPFPEMPFRDVTEPGAYLATESGRIIRITVERLSAGDLFLLCSPDTWVARISPNAVTAIGTLRDLAGRNGYFVNF